MFEEIPTAETTRIRLTYKELRKFVLSFREGEAAFHEAVGELEKTRRSIAELPEVIERTRTAFDQAIAKAVAELNQDAVWAERFKTMADEVHDNGYAALETLVNDRSKTHEERLSQMLLHSASRFEQMVDNLAAAVNGKPPLPIIPDDASIDRKVLGVVARTFVRCRRLCIDAMPPALIVIALLLLILGLQNWHHAIG